VRICQAATAQQITLARGLFEEYAAWIGIHLSFQAFSSELAGLPGLYVRPRGRLLLAMAESDAAGCAALRPLKHDVCEMKRLFVRPDFRGKGIGRMLAEHPVPKPQLPIRALPLCAHPGPPQVALPSSWMRSSTTQPGPPVCKRSAAAPCCQTP